MSNEIHDNTFNGKLIDGKKSHSLDNKPQCVICEFAMTELEHVLENKTTEVQLQLNTLKI